MAVRSSKVIFALFSLLLVALSLLVVTPAARAMDDVTHDQVHDTGVAVDDSDAPQETDDDVTAGAPVLDESQVIDSSQEGAEEHDGDEDSVDEADSNVLLPFNRELKLLFIGGDSIEIDQIEAKNYVEPGWQIRDRLGNRINVRERQIDVDYTLDRAMRNGEVGVYEVVYIATDQQKGEVVAQATRTVTVTDIDECDPLHPRHNCSVDATCVNIPNSFICQCNAGYVGDGYTCVDIDECATGEHNCSPNAKCINTKGSFECECNSGFRDAGNARLIDGVDDCVDIDECAEKTANCSPDAICHNTPGSYECECKPGYVGNGRECKPGMELIDESLCLSACLLVCSCVCVCVCVCSCLYLCVARSLCMY
jgi:hypothetical protein